ncbi:MAG TPA: response regulator transcription factor [Chitinophagaceae bacterium]|nr:response regulator transcription factor [Chitinophagaceae bacterium]
MHRLLLVEDNEDLGAILLQYLETSGFEVIWRRNGEEGMAAYREFHVDCCILDIMMPVKDGFTLAAEIHQFNPMAVFLFLTARKEKEDRIRGLKLHADDYITKPFDAEELVLRIRNLLRRTVPGKDPGITVMGNFAFDFNNLLLSEGAIRHKLTLQEARLIRYLFEHRNTLVRREELLENIWGKNDYFLGRSMDVFITRIRKYFKTDHRIRIESTRGIGITFILED